MRASQASEFDKFVEVEWHKAHSKSPIACSDIEARRAALLLDLVHQVTGPASIELLFTEPSSLAQAIEVAPIDSLVSTSRSAITNRLGLVLRASRLEHPSCVNVHVGMVSRYKFRRRTIPALIVPVTITSPLMPTYVALIAV